MRAWQWFLAAAAALSVILSVINASWIASRPGGPLILVARRGLVQPPGKGSGPCAAAAIRAGEHDFIENTLRSISNARHFGADAVDLDVWSTKDGELVVFADETLDCRTNGRGRIAEKTLAELKRLDVGYGYTPDGGRSFPLRGRGIGGMPTVREVLWEVPGMRVLFNFRRADPADGERMAAILRDVPPAQLAKLGFHGEAAPLQRLKPLTPGAWTFSRDTSEACLSGYLKTGWTSFLPATCRNTTLLVGLDRPWTLWGWPKRFLARMQGAGTRVVMLGDPADGAEAGLRRTEQLDDVPRDFRGYVIIDDFYEVGRALER